MKQLLFFLLLLPLSGFSMIVESGNSIVIEQPVDEDLYLAAGTVTINGPVHGDLVVFGGTVLVNDSISRDVLVAGGRVIIKGRVAGRIRCIGGTLILSGTIGGDLVAAGGTLEIEKNSTIEGSLLATGGNLILNGTVKGDTRIAARVFSFHGAIGRNLECRAGKIELDGTVLGSSLLVTRGDLLIGHNAALSGDTRYWAPETIDFSRFSKKAPAVRDEDLAPITGHWYFLGAETGIAALLYVGMGLTLILLLQYFFPAILTKAADQVFSRPRKSMGLGILFFIATPLVIALAFLTILGIPLGIFLLFAYVLAFTCSTAMTSVVAANWLNELVGDPDKYWRRVWTALIFFVAFRLLLTIPFLGWVLFALSVCTAFGSLLLALRWKRSSPGLTTVIPAA